MDRDFLKEVILDLNIDIELTDKMLDQFVLYYELLMEKNKVMNLTAIKEEKEVVIKHFADSLSLLKANHIEDDKRVIDIGTGAGFPSIPLKIMLPKVHFTLVDSLNKRIKFLDEVIEALGLTKIETIHSRVEDLAFNKKYREKFDICVARAVANFSVLSEFCSPFVISDGLLIALKGKTYEEELKGSKVALKEMKLDLEDVTEVVLPKTDIKHYIVTLRKLSKISTKYPRKAGIINKNPL
ncbi:MAG: 16S rRNA (guanine(527)-N(7))-methyltransferase RsmG [Lachnospirales bacterium]